MAYVNAWKIQYIPRIMQVVHASVSFIVWSNILLTHWGLVTHIFN